MSLGPMERWGGKLLVATLALGLVLALVGLFAATSESLRRQEHSFPFTEAVEPELSLQNSEAQNGDHAPGVTAWPTR